MSLRALIAAAISGGVAAFIGDYFHSAVIGAIALVVIILATVAVIARKKGVQVQG